MMLIAVLIGFVGASYGVYAHSELEKARGRLASIGILSAQLRECVARSARSESVMREASECIDTLQRENDAMRRERVSLTVRTPNGRP